MICVFHKNEICNTSNQAPITFSFRRCPSVKYLSRTIRVPITFCIASQCLVLSAAFLRLVMTGMPCLKLITFCFSFGTTLLGGRPESEQMLMTLNSVLCKNLCYTRTSTTTLQTESTGHCREVANVGSLTYSRASTTGYCGQIFLSHSRDLLLCLKSKE